MNLLSYNNCNFCPRSCNVNRSKGELGYCLLDSDLYISSIVIHKGEEPPISGDKGICNVFFAHCNLQCVYCQNYQISNNNCIADDFKMTYENAVNQIISILEQGINILGFVSPSHQVLQMIKIIDEVKKHGFNPIIVYNTNGYDKVETLKLLENIVDIYLPDFKYFDEVMSQNYSFAKNYPIFAKKAIKEMYRQKGNSLFINDSGYAEKGLIIRHLVLPHNIDNTISILNFIADEISPNVHISLMSQYSPIYNSYKFNELTKTITPDDYKKITDEMFNLGLTKGWIQELSSKDYYLPDFEKEHPFEN